jgi:hypothetical protein
MAQMLLIGKAEDFTPEQAREEAIHLLDGLSRLQQRKVVQGKVVVSVNRPRTILDDGDE